LQESVEAWLHSRGGVVLHPVPDDHWLVRATDDTIHALLTHFPGTTAAALEPSFKQATSLDSLVSVVSAYDRAAQKAETQPAVGISHAVSRSSANSAAADSSADEAASGSSSGSGYDSSSDTKSKGVKMFKSMLPKELAGVAASQTESGEVMVTLTVLGQPLVGSTDKEIKAASAAWVQELQQGLEAALDAAAYPGCQPNVTGVGILSAAHVRVCTQHMPAAISWLSEQPSVTYVDIVRERKRLDLVAASAVQAGSLPDPFVDLRTAASAQPLWEAGIDGSGQIVGVSDSGADLDTCYLYDPKFPNILSNKTNLFHDVEINKTYFYSTQHRKVAMYVLYDGEAADDDWSHGTHCSASAVGSCYLHNATKNPDDATGVAPGAKLAMFDVSSNANPDILDVPTDVGKIAEPLYQRGVRILSSSWGSNDIFEYDAPSCTMLDTYVWARPDMLMFFAAGNNGTNTRLLQTTGTITSPATCKNVIAVGATESVWSDAVDVIPLLDKDGKQVSIDTSTFKGTGSSSDPKLMFTKISADGKRSAAGSLTTRVHIRAWSGPATPWTAVKKEIKVVAAVPDLGCDPLAGDYTGKLVLISRGNCTFSMKGEHAIAAGAAAVLVYFNSSGPADGLVTPDAGELADSTIPFGFITNANATTLLKALSGGRLVMNVVTQTPLENVAYFSSYGAAPAVSAARREIQDLRTKPDIVAPGYTRSAKSDGKYGHSEDSCLTETMMGTSMATPVAAGAAALVRQYFIEGFYPSGQRTPADSIEPSGSLVRAVMISGATAMNGMSSVNGLPLAPPPSPFQGFGRVNLANSLPLKSRPGWNLRIWDRQVFRNQLQNGTFTITATGKGPLVITVAWMDWPGWPGYYRPMVNDLDLKVDGPASDVDTISKPSSVVTYWGNNQRGGDGHNTIERVYIDAPTAGQYNITVIPYYLYIAARPQLYTVVALGAIEEVSPTVPLVTKPTTPTTSKNETTTPASTRNNASVKPPPSPASPANHRVSATSPRPNQNRKLRS